MARKIFVTFMIIAILLVLTDLVMILFSNSYLPTEVNIFAAILLIVIGVLAALSIRKKTYVGFKVLICFVLVFMFPMQYSYNKVSHGWSNDYYTAILASAWGEKKVIREAVGGEHKNFFTQKIVSLPIKFRYQHGNMTVTARITYLDLDKGLRLRDKMEEEYAAPLLKAGVEAVYWGMGFREADQACDIMGDDTSNITLAGHLECLEKWMAPAILREMQRLKNPTAHGFFEIVSVETNKLF